MNKNDKKEKIKIEHLEINKNTIKIKNLCLEITNISKEEVDKEAKKKKTSCFKWLILIAKKILNHILK